MVSLDLPESLIAALASAIAAALPAAPAKEQPRWMTVEEAAHHLRTSPNALRKSVQRGQIPAYQPLGARTRFIFDRFELDRWVTGE